MFNAAIFRAILLPLFLFGSIHHIVRDTSPEKRCTISAICHILLRGDFMSECKSDPTIIVGLKILLYQ